MNVNSLKAPSIYIFYFNTFILLIYFLSNTMMFVNDIVICSESSEQLAEYVGGGMSWKGEE